jgi:DNA modification methylase
MPTDEWIVILAKPGFKLKNRGVSGYGSVWRFSPDNNNPHPAPFPYELPKRILDSVARINKPILDPFSGSGTVRICAYDFGYDFIGSELSAKYCEIQEKRFTEHIAQLTLWPQRNGDY